MGDWHSDNNSIPVDSVSFGVNLFFYPDCLKQLDYAKELRCNRVRTYITDKNYNPDLFSQYLNKAKQYGIAVLVLLWDETFPNNTPILADEISCNHAKRHDLYLYEIGNEPNGEICPGNLIQPDRYYDIYKRSFNVIRMNRQDTHIFPAGLIGSQKADIPIIKYIKELKKLGIDKYIKDPIRSSGWNIHLYQEQWYKAKDIINIIRKDKTDRIWLTETGTPLSVNITQQKSWHDYSMKMAKEWGIEQIFYYGLMHSGNPMNSTDDFSLLDDNWNRREMFNYIKNY